MEDSRVMDLERGTCVPFEAWTGGRQISCVGTNAGAPKLPFQSWHHFKEAFTPEIVAQAIAECGRPVRHCIDPFGGSGTTPLACQFLGVRPSAIEVNPYLADVIESKLAVYDPDDLALDLERICLTAKRLRGSLQRFSALPDTFIESDAQSRWIFDLGIARRIAAILDSIETIPLAEHRRFFRVLLGGMLVSISNIVVNGKGRRYRSNWRERIVEPCSVDRAFRERATLALGEVQKFGNRRCRTYTLLRGDCRSMLALLKPADVAVFSPPYPNSFDYTDVYNIELWMLGYLSSRQSNRSLRVSTLCSHVQVKREYPVAPKESRLLSRSLSALKNADQSLWSSWIPAMVGGYFADMQGVLTSLHESLTPRGEAWGVVGDSQYAGISIPVASILAELAPSIGFDVIRREPFRSMRSSSQQGGRRELDETLIVFRKRD